MRLYIVLTLILDVVASFICKVDDVYGQPLRKKTYFRFWTKKMPMREGSGRKKDPIWSYVSEIQGQDRVSCDFCSQAISKKIERIKLHVSKCKAWIHHLKSSSMFPFVNFIQWNKSLFHWMEIMYFASLKQRKKCTYIHSLCYAMNLF